MQIDLESIDSALRNARERLLAARAPHGGWEGELASSALATATAIFALGAVDQKGAGGQRREAVQRGLAWLVAVQNHDGGWGDTPASLSNISTTALAWAAFVFLDSDGKKDASRKSAERWLRQAAGSLAPEQLAEAIASRYGKDRTFSVPILSMLAMAGCLGDERRSWRLVPQLPFELAACPHDWFKWLRLPVVSYALPALIGLGYLRHRRMPSSNPATSAVRNLVARRVLRKLAMIQPTSGGFLEATPLTSFVVMSLAGSGESSNRIVDQGVEFLRRSQRGDGSWPIDTNLATWVTTLAVNALGSGGDSLDGLSEPDCGRILTWLLRQQYQSEHPYTHAAPGGWAWTDLPGGVPDADDTAGALLALHVLADAQAATQSAAKGVAWLIDLQNGDGGIPTFCPGWGRLPFDRSSPDITAHAVRALSVWRVKLNADSQRHCDKALVRMLRFLVAAQRSDGAWSPLWFGNQHSPGEENLTYGTSRVLRAAEVVPAQFAEPQWWAAVERGCRWLFAAHNEDGGWGGDVNAPSSIEETSLSLEALSSMVSCGTAAGRSPRRTSQEIVAGIGDETWQRALHRGAAWLCEASDEGRSFQPSPIGLYFAKLWYHEKLYPLIFSVAALRRLRLALHENQDNAPASGIPPVVSGANTGNALSLESMSSSPLYLDYNATTPVDPRVAELMMRIFQSEVGNAGSTSHDYGIRAKRHVEHARQQIARVVDARRHEVIFTSGATEANNLALLGLAEYGEQAGRRHIVSTQIEHKAVLEPLAELARRGFEVTLVPPTTGGWVEASAVTDAVRDDTLLVSVMHANNETGILQPIEEIADLLWGRAVFFHVDAAQGFGKALPPLRHQRIDLISVSGHKIFGPQGIGALVARRRNRKLPPLKPLCFGGGQEFGLRPGTLPVALIGGFGLAAELAIKDVDERRRSCAAFRQELLSALRPFQPVIHGDEGRSLPHVVNLSFPGLNADLAIDALSPIVAASDGAACTSICSTPSHVLTAMGLPIENIEGGIRLSWGYMTIRPDWLQFGDSLRSKLGRIKNMAPT